MIKGGLYFVDLAILEPRAKILTLILLFFGKVFLENLKHRNSEIFPKKVKKKITFISAQTSLQSYIRGFSMNRPCKQAQIGIFVQTNPVPTLNKLPASCFG